MKNITNMYSIPYRAENMQPIHYACREYDKLAYEQQNEIERLNNIINELEKEWKSQQEHYRYYKDNRYRTFLSKNLDKLKELKENVK